MNIKEAVDVLRRHNEWRRYDGEGIAPMQESPREIGVAIDLLTLHSARTSWQPIADAPRDGTRIVGLLTTVQGAEASPHCAQPIITRYVAGDFEGWIIDSSIATQEDLTHFMFLPELPL